MFNVMINIRDALQANDTDGVREQITYMQEGLEKIINQEAIIGSRVNRVNAAESRTEDDIINFTDFLSDVEDADATQSVINYETDLLTLQYTLEVASKLSQPKLVDFLG